MFFLEISGVDPVLVAARKASAPAATQILSMCIMVVSGLIARSVMGIV